MKKYLLILGVSAGFSGLCQEGTNFSLLEAEEYGINNSEKVKNAMLDVEIARKKVWETTAIGLPQVNAEVNFQNLIDIPTSVVDATLFNPMAAPGSVMEFQMGQKYSASAGLNVNQLIFDGSYIVALKFSKFWMTMNEAGVERTKVETKAMIREAYYNVLVAQKNLELMDSILISTTQLQKRNPSFFDNGFILKEDADQIMLALNRITINKQSAERQVEIAENLLKLQMGYDFDKELTLTENLDDVLNGIIAGSPVTAEGSITSNNTYQMMEDQMTLDEFNLMKEKAGYYPSVGAFFSHSQNAFRNEFDFFGNGAWYPTTVWGFGIQVPITSSGQKVVKVQQAEMKLEQDANNLTNLERSLEFQELQLKAMFMNAMDQMNIEKQNVALAQFIYSQSLKKKSLGAISSLEVTQIQNQLLQAEGTYIGSIMQLLNVKIQLDKLYSK